MSRKNRQPTVKFGHRVDSGPSVCVVDPQAGQFPEWQALAQANGLGLEIVASAEEALRRARLKRFDLWVVNAKLPGLSGCELCGMLRARDDRAPIHVVADTYSAADERAAYAARATLFACQPLTASMLDAWLAERRARTRTAPRPPSIRLRS
jgi:DNA-binding response OmpR family regulator